MSLFLVSIVLYFMLEQVSANRWCSDDGLLHSNHLNKTTLFKNTENCFLWLVFIYTVNGYSNLALAILNCSVHFCSCRELIRNTVLYSNPALKKITHYIIQQDVRIWIRGWSGIKLFWINAYTCQFKVLMDVWYLVITVLTPTWAVTLSM